MSHPPKNAAPKQLRAESALPTRFLRMPVRARVASSSEPATRRYAAAELANLFGPARKQAPSAAPGRVATVNTVIAPSPVSKRPPETARRALRAPAPRSLLLIAAPLVGAALMLLGLSWAARRPHAVPDHTASPALGNPPSSLPGAEPTARTPPDGALEVSESAPPMASTVTPARAAAALAEGRYGDALSAYRTLASKQPARDAYAVIARILERKLQARCQKHTEAGAIPCSSPSN